MRKLLPTLSAIGLMLGLVAGCGTDDTVTDTADPATTTEAPLTGSITVSAAASLTESFTAIRDEFVAANPDAEIVINFGSSGQLSTQIQEGAPADVAAFADVAPMTALESAGLLAGAPETLGRNQLVIVTKPGNPKDISSLADLATVGIVSLCAETVPCGKFAGQALATAGVEIPVSSVTRGQDVKATLTAVTEGDAEAAIVYVTDAKAAGDAVDAIEIPEDQNVIATYPIAVVAASQQQELAEAFVAFVLGEEGQAALGEAGFLSP